MFSTPVGDIEVRIDGKAVPFDGRSIKKDGTCAHVDGRYALYVDFKPDGKEHSISCHILGWTVDDRDGIESGERLELKSFYKGDVKLSIGMEGDAGYIGNERVSDSGYDYDNLYRDDGVEYYILPDTKTEHYEFGVSWIVGVNDENDVEPWFGADIAYIKDAPPEEVFCQVSKKMIKNIACIETRDAVDGNIVPKYMHEGVSEVGGCKDICKRCIWHEY